MYVSFPDAPPPLEETGGPQVKDISGSVLPGISKWAFSIRRGNRPSHHDVWPLRPRVRGYRCQLPLVVLLERDIFTVPRRGWLFAAQCTLRVSDGQWLGTDAVVEESAGQELLRIADGGPWEHGALRRPARRPARVRRKRACFAEVLGTSIAGAGSLAYPESRVRTFGSRRRSAPGKRSRLVLCPLPRASTDACGRQMSGAPMRRACGWTTRITEAELAARNRRARFPASPCFGVLRTASAAERPHTRPAETGVGICVPLKFSGH